MKPDAQKPETERLGLEVTLLYRELKRALETATPAAAQTGLAMTLVLTAETLGHRGPAAATWIDDTAAQAKAVLHIGGRRGQ